MRGTGGYLANAWAVVLLASLAPAGQASPAPPVRHVPPPPPVISTRAPRTFT